MPPKFLSSKVSHVWREPTAQAASPKRSRKEDPGDAEARISSEQLRQLVEQRVAAKAAASERTELARELSDLKSHKGSAQAKAVNYGELQRKQRRLKELEKEQAERDRELGGGAAIVHRTKVGKATKKRSKSLRELGMTDGAVKVSKRTIAANSSKKRTLL